MIKWTKAKLVDILKIDHDKELWSVIDEEGVTRKAVSYPNMISSLQQGEEVWLNSTATSLGLGTGGVDFIVSRSISTHIDTTLPDGHIMKLRYTPYQLCVQAVEEQSSSGHEALKEASTIDGMITIVGELHSMLPIVAGVIHHQSIQSKKECKVVYIMTDGAALPIAFSDNVKKLKELGWLTTTITAGNAFGGDGEAVNIYSALLAAKHIYQADIAVVLMGPGTVGTGTKFGTTSIEFGTTINAVHSLEGTAVGIPRVSFADQRERHRGISHHTLTSLTKVALVSANIAVPELDYARSHFLQQQLDQSQITRKHNVMMRNSIDIEQVSSILSEFPGRITTMGRGIEEEDAFFLTIAENAMLAWELWLQSFQ